MHIAATSTLRNIAGQMPWIARKAEKLSADHASGQNGFGQAYTPCSPPHPPSATR